MAYREFEDPSGRRWMAWDTYPQSETLSRVRSDYARGWLSFESGVERRRHVPVPPGWEEMPVRALCALLDEATPVNRARREDTERAQPVEG